MPPKIKHNEQISGEKWRLDRTQSTRVSNGLVAFRLKRPESLPMKLTLCARFGKRQSVHRVPPLGGSEVMQLTPYSLKGSSGEGRDGHGAP
jgi:hypothetical protein